MTEPIQQPKKKGRLQQLREIIKPPDPTKRIDDAWGVMKEVGGFRPLFNVRDLEQRRKEIGDILTDVQEKTSNETMEKDVINKTFKLFFLSGSAWYRGLDNRELTKKVALFLRLHNEVAMLPAFTRDLFMCSMQLLHLSFQALDVSNTPGYVIQVNNVPPPNRHSEGLNQVAQPSKEY